METGLKKEIYEYMAPAFHGVAGRETSEEYVVPDTMPDVGAILDAEGMITLRSKDTAAGYVQLSAAVGVSVVYAPEDGGAMRSLELSLPADIRVDAPGVDENCGTVVRLRIRGVDARVINSRKISVRVDVETEVRCYRRDALELAVGLEDDSNPAHILPGAAETVTVADVREKTFAVTDEFPFPPGCTGMETILSRRAEALVEDVKYVGDKAVFRGRIRTELLFSDPDTGKSYVGQYETEYSQIMEVSAGDGEASPEITLFITGVYFDLPEYGREPGRIAMEMHLGAQCVCRRKRELRYIADVYSNRTELIPAMDSLRVVRDVRSVTARQTVAGKAEPFAGDGEIVRATANVGGVALEDGAVKTAVNIRLIYRRPDGNYESARCRLTADFTSSEISEDTTLENITVTVTDVYGSGSGGDVRAALQMDATVIEEGNVSCVSGVEEDAEAWKARERTPSITLIRAPEGTDLWTVARKYHSTVEAITAANDGRKEGLLLIPKGR